MLINLSKYLSSDDMLFIFEGKFIIDDEEFLEKTHLNKAILFNGEFFKVEDSILLTGIVKYSYEETCARCLTEFENTSEVKFEAVVGKNLEKDDESDEIKLAIVDGCVNLDETIKQMIYLSMPMKAICSKDCKGICPNCGVNLNIEKCKCENNITDPRFDKLKNLLKD
ncbi:uncharacterized protein J2Z76_001339 [Sedimentibacter acidaminivorans]|jgi:DUF177 domain-containing protein|uniref:DUF177 domain-containing protein n=1 Tax=Sedimentibacter acidaminivorans TaxID=913099 RepID=A0ABS4GCQ8_9FIRM|nr:DUF177 domain-containing protein [Sedimentibacter acidaminivorans]MBP1925480.1 uncharacterized protein [Sedimentibacter acidaminivorans]